MTVAELMEKINQKKKELETTTDKTVLEAEIKELEQELAVQNATKRPRRTAFLDECAG
jgi:hypothetical protein